MPDSRPCVPCHGSGGGGDTSAVETTTTQVGPFDSVFSFFSNLFSGNTTVAMTDISPIQENLYAADMGLLMPIMLVGYGLWVLTRLRR